VATLRIDRPAWRTNFGSNVHDLATWLRRKGPDGNRRGRDILLEGLKEEESDEHDVVQRPVWCEARKGQFL